MNREKLQDEIESVEKVFREFAKRARDYLDSLRACFTNGSEKQ